MSVSSTGSVSLNSIASLQKHLKADQKTLTEARNNHASNTTLAADAAKVAADQRAIAAATARQAEAAQKNASNPDSSAAASPAAPAPTTHASTNVDSAGHVDISV